MPKLLDLIIPGRDDPRTDFRIRSQLPFLALTAALLLAVFAILLPLGFLSNGADGFFWALLPLIAAQAALSHFSSFAKELDERIVRLKEAVADIRASTDRVSEAGRLNIEHTKKLQL